MFCEENSFSPQNYKKKVNYTNFFAKKTSEHVFFFKNKHFFTFFSVKI